MESCFIRQKILYIIMAIDYRGEKFSGYNKPKNARTKTKK